MPLPKFHALLNLNDVDGAVVDGELKETPLAGVTATLKSNVYDTFPVTYGGKVYRIARSFDAVFTETGDLVNEDGDDLLLPANDPGLNVENIQWTIVIKIPDGARMRTMQWTFPAGEADQVVNLATLTPVPATDPGPILRGPGIDLVARDGTVIRSFVQGDEVGSFDIGDLIWNGTADSIADAQPAGKEVLRSNTTDAIRALINAVSADDLNGAVVEAVAADPTAAAAAAAAAATAVTAKVDDLDLVEANDILIDNYAFAIADAANRISLAVYADGTLRIFKLDAASIGDGSLTSAKLSPAVQSQLVAEGIGTMLQTVTDTGGYAWALIDSSGRIGLGVKLDGTVVGNFALPAATAPLLPEVSGSTPSRKLWSLNHTTGNRSLITSAGDPRDAVEDNGSILFTDNTGRKALTGGRIIPAYPDRTKIVAWGDSLTNSSDISGFTDLSLSWPGRLDALLDPAIEVVNQGIGGDTADDIVIRQGGYVLQLNVTGGTIPTSGEVACTTTQGFGHRFNSAWSAVGTLAGVAGTLSRAADQPIGQYTFTRSGSGAAVPVAGSVPFLSTAATTYESNPVVLFMGRNDITVTMPDGLTIPDTAPRVLAAYDAAVSRLRAYHREFLVVGTTTATTETVGTPRYITVTTINKALAAKYGNRFYDLRHYLVTQCIYDLGITPNTADLTAIAGDTLPPSIMASGGTDEVHYAPATAAKVAAVLKTQLDARGWTL